MRRTLRAETTHPPSVDIVRQQRVFNTLRHEYYRAYNETRAHAPWRLIQPRRVYDGTLAPLEYPCPNHSLQTPAALPGQCLEQHHVV